MSVRIKYNPNALWEIRRDPALVAQEEALAQQIADRANSSGAGTYAVSSQQGRRAPQGRWRTSVVTADYAAIRDNAANNRLIRSLS